MGSKSMVQAGNANVKTVHCNSSDSESNDRLQDTPEELRRYIGPSCVKELVKYFTLSSDEEQSHVNTRTTERRYFERRDNK